MKLSQLFCCVVTNMLVVLEEMVAEGLAVLVSDGSYVVEFTSESMSDNSFLRIKGELDIDLRNIVCIAARIDTKHLLARRVFNHLNVACMVMSVKNQVKSIDR